ncbi:MAG: elongation factor P maturation arginine rhamnosyltransferase EarP, partial [Treponema sp.]|nr:elongation factor P maturation arginine rhamnosyltransferase EarP [Treponema sp.]
SPFKIEKLPFMQQEEFDEFITRMDFLFVRGEDSLARAALTGLPFVWQAYKQDENYQLVKVKALLERMRPYFDEEVFKDIQDFYQSYNDYENPAKAVPLTKMLLASAKKENTEGFKDFSEKLIQNGNLARHLLDFIDALQA